MSHHPRPLKKKEVKLIGGIFHEKQDSIYHLMEHLKPKRVRASIETQLTNRSERSHGHEHKDSITQVRQHPEINVELLRSPIA